MSHSQAELRSVISSRATSRDLVRALRAETDALIESFDHHPLLGSVIRGDATREQYVAFLRATYHYVRWSGPLLAKSAEGLRRSGRCLWLADLLEAKTAEEAPHDAWALDDLRRAGDHVELVKATPLPLAVQAYIDFSLTLAEDGSPAFLGAAYTLERISMRRATMAAENLCARGAIPGIYSAVSFLRGHGDADEGHTAELDRVLLRVTSPQDQSDILLAAGVMRALYPRFF